MADRPPPDETAVPSSGGAAGAGADQLADPFVSPPGSPPGSPSVSHHHPHHIRFSAFDKKLFALGPASSPAQAKVALGAHLAEVELRIAEVHRIGTALVTQRNTVIERRAELDELQSEDQLKPDLRQRLLDIEKEYNDVERDTARALLPKQRAPSGEPNPSAAGGPASSASSGQYPSGRRSVSPTKLESLATGSPSKLGVPDRKVRNGEASSSRIQDIEFAAEISTSLITQVRSLQALLQEREEDLQVATRNNRLLSLNLEMSRERIRDLDEKGEKFREENWKIEVQLHELASEQLEGQEREKRLNQALNQLRAERSGLEREVDDTRSSFIRLAETREADARQHDIELGAARRLIASAEGERAALQRKVTDLQTQNRDLAQVAAASHRGRAADGTDRESGEASSDEQDSDRTGGRAGGRATPEHSPPQSPTKGPTPRHHSALEGETLRSSLNHAQCQLQNQRSLLHREKAEKLELRRLLQESRDELDRARNELGVGGSGPSGALASGRRAGARNAESKRPVPSRLLMGGAAAARGTTTKTEIIEEDSHDGDSDATDSDTDEPDWEDYSSLSPRTKPSARHRPDVPLPSIETDHFETANETSDPAFETANERGTETEDFVTGVENSSSGFDDDTETEASPVAPMAAGRASTAGATAGSGAGATTTTTATGPTTFKTGNPFARLRTSPSQQPTRGGSGQPMPTRHTPSLPARTTSFLSTASTTDDEGDYDEGDYDEDMMMAEQSFGELRTPTSLPNPRLKLRISRGLFGGRRSSSRQSSEEPLQSSPAGSFGHNATVAPDQRRRLPSGQMQTQQQPQQQQQQHQQRPTTPSQSLFSELAGLAELGDDDNDSVGVSSTWSRGVTPSRSVRATTPGAALGGGVSLRQPSMPFLHPSPRLLTVDRGTMTDMDVITTEDRSRRDRASSSHSYASPPRAPVGHLIAGLPVYRRDSGSKASVAGSDDLEAVLMYPLAAGAYQSDMSSSDGDAGPSSGTRLLTPPAASSDHGLTLPLSMFKRRLSTPSPPPNRPLPPLPAGCTPPPGAIKAPFEQLSAQLLPSSGGSSASPTSLAMSPIRKQVVRSKDTYSLFPKPPRRPLPLEPLRPMDAYRFALGMSPIQSERIGSPDVGQTVIAPPVLAYSGIVWRDVVWGDSSPSELEREQIKPVYVEHPKTAAPSLDFSDILSGQISPTTVVSELGFFSSFAGDVTPLNEVAEYKSAASSLGFSPILSGDVIPVRMVGRASSDTLPVLDFSPLHSGSISPADLAAESKPATPALGFSPILSGDVTPSRMVGRASSNALPVLDLDLLRYENITPTHVEESKPAAPVLGFSPILNGDATPSRMAGRASSSTLPVLDFGLHYGHFTPTHVAAESEPGAPALDFSPITSADVTPLKMVAESKNSVPSLGFSPILAGDVTSIHMAAKSKVIDHMLGFSDIYSDEIIPTRVAAEFKKAAPVPGSSDAISTDMTRTDSAAESQASSPALSFFDVLSDQMTPAHVAAKSKVAAPVLVPSHIFDSQDGESAKTAESKIHSGPALSMTPIHTLYKITDSPIQAPAQSRSAFSSLSLSRVVQTYEIVPVAAASHRPAPCTLDSQIESASEQAVADRRSAATNNILENSRVPIASVSHHQDDPTIRVIDFGYIRSIETAPVPDRRTKRNGFILPSRSRDSPSPDSHKIHSSVSEQANGAAIAVPAGDEDQDQSHQTQQHSLGSVDSERSLSPQETSANVAGRLNTLPPSTFAPTAGPTLALLPSTAFVPTTDQAAQTTLTLLPLTTYVPMTDQAAQTTLTYLPSSTFVPMDDQAAQTPLTLLPPTTFVLMTDQAAQTTVTSPPSPTLVSMADQAAQTTVTSLPSSTLVPTAAQATQSTFAGGSLAKFTSESEMARRPEWTGGHERMSSIDSVASPSEGLGQSAPRAAVRAGKATAVMASLEGAPLRRPGSATSQRRDMATPPLPVNHKQAIEAARTGGVGAATSMTAGSMGPPAWPASANRPTSATRPTSPQSARGVAAPRPAPSVMKAASMYGASGAGESSSRAPGGRPSAMAMAGPAAAPSSLSRRSSVSSSFASEIDSRFNGVNAYQPRSGPGSSPHGGQAQGQVLGPDTDPRMIQAITQTMIGEFLYKYTRKTGRDEMSENRHCRYFWVHPYTRTLYWSDRDPTSTSAELRAKSVPIEAVRVVDDNNPMPPGLHNQSLVVIAPGRAVKFTCPTSSRHETWLNALSYLLLRTSPGAGQADAEDVAEGALTREDVDEFNPPVHRPGVSPHHLSSYASSSRHRAQPTALSSASVASRPRGPASISSYNSRTTTRNESPTSIDMLSSMNMAVPTLSPSKSTANTSAAQWNQQHRPSFGNRLSDYIKGGRPTMASLRGRGSTHSQPGTIYSASAVVHDDENDDDDGHGGHEYNGSIDPRSAAAAREQSGLRMENVRACCDGKHDCGTLSHGLATASRSGRHQSQSHSAGPSSSAPLSNVTSRT